MTDPTYYNLIGGQRVAAATGKTILNLNPAKSPAPSTTASPPRSTLGT